MNKRFSFRSIGVVLLLACLMLSGFYHIAENSRPVALAGSDGIVPDRLFREPRGDSPEAHPEAIGEAGREERRGGSHSPGVDPVRTLMESSRMIRSAIERDGDDHSMVRTALYETSFKYPLVRVDEQILLGSDGNVRTTRRLAMVADHVLVHVPRERRAWFLDQMEQSQQMTVRKELDTGEHFLVAGQAEVGLQTIETLLHGLRHEGVVSAEPDYLRFASVMPDDPDFGRQWSLHNTGQSGGRADADVDGPEAWAIETGNRDVIVAVLDTGVQYDHPDLAANMWTDASGDHGYDYVDDDTDPADVTGEKNPGHGTHVAGIIGAVGDNGRGMAGVCWKVRIMALRFLDVVGRGADSDAIAAVRYATDHGARVMNMSFGSPGGFNGDAFYRELERAQSRGVLFCAAAGNGGEDKIGDNNDLFSQFPANFALDNVISVAACDASDNLGTFSNFGAHSVDLAAPGVDIFSTLPSQSYGRLSGTSMAAPHVAGAAALALAARPDLSVSELRQRLLDNVDPVPAFADKVATGGRLNLYRAIEGLQGPVIQLEAMPVVSSSGNSDDFINPGEEFSIEFTAANSGNEEVREVEAELTVLDGADLVELIAAEVSVGDLEFGESRTITEGIRLRAVAAANLPRTVRLLLTVSAVSQTQTWQVEIDVTIHEPGHFSGSVVRRATGAGIPGATVHYEGPVSGTATTDTLGLFEIMAVAGTYEVHVTAADLIDSPVQEVSAPASGLRFAIGSASVSVDPTPLAIHLAPDSRRETQLTLRHTGDTPSDIDYAISFQGPGGSGGLFGLVHGSDTRVVELDATSGAVLSTVYTVPENEFIVALAATEDSVWLVGNSFPVFNTTLKRIDLATGAVTLQTDLENVGSIQGFSGDSESLYVASSNFFQTDLLRIDPTTGEVTDTGVNLPGGARSLASAPDRGSLYVATFSGIEEREVDTLAHVRTLGLGDLASVSELAYAEDSLVVLGHRWNGTTFGLEQVLENWHPDTGAVISRYAEAPSLGAIAGGGAGTPPWLSLDRRNGALASGGEEVIPLVFDATGLDPGTYGTTLMVRSNMIENAHETEILLTVGDLDDLTDWFSGHGIPVDEAMKDSDGDGHANLMEYVFDGHPGEHDSPGGFPRLGHSPAGTVVKVEMVIRRGLPERMLVIEQSEDLHHWTEAREGSDLRVTSRSDVGPHHERVWMDWLSAGSNKFLRATVQIEGGQ